MKVSGPIWGGSVPVWSSYVNIIIDLEKILLPHLPQTGKE